MVLCNKKSPHPSTTFSKKKTMFQAEAIQVDKNHCRSINRLLSPSFFLSLNIFLAPADSLHYSYYSLCMLLTSHEQLWKRAGTRARRTPSLMCFDSRALRPGLWSGQEGGSPLAARGCVSSYLCNIENDGRWWGVAGWGQGYKKPTKCKTSTGCAWSEKHLVE